MATDTSPARDGAPLRRSGEQPLPPQPAPILATKLYAPRARRDLVPRPRLTARLDAALDGRLTLVSAPAGFGKTTLISDWLRQSPGGPAARPVAWLSLDEADSDPTRFLQYLVAALRTLEPSVGESTLALLAAPQVPSLLTLLAILSNDLAALPEGSILVLDDYHVLQGRPVHEALAFLVDHLPPQLHLLIATREDPPLPLARMRARREITEVRVADLRFSAAETGSFLRDAMSLDLSAGDVTALEEHTEGWAVGLQLAALSLRDRQDVSGSVAALAADNRYILDYLVEEVLARQPEHIQSFLLQTSILRRLCAPLCDALIGEQGPPVPSQLLLEEIERANLFLVPLDAERHWYRYHHLFADLLQARLRQVRPALLPVLHARAAAWYEQNGPVEEAIEHALAGSDFDRAAELIGRQSNAIAQRSPLPALLRWFEALPPDIVRSRPEVSLNFAWIQAGVGHIDLAEEYARITERALAAPQPSGDPRALNGDLATLFAFISAQRGDVARTIELSGRALELLPPDALEKRSEVLFFLGSAYRTADNLPAAIDVCTEAEALSRAAGTGFYTTVMSVALAAMHVLQGHLQEAAGLCRRALAIPDIQRLPYRGMAYIGLGLVLLEWNDLEAASDHLSRGVDLLEPVRDMNINIVHGYAGLARLRLARGDIAGALAAVERAEDIARDSHRPHIERPAELARVRFWLATNDLEAAGRWAGTFPAKSRTDPPSLREPGMMAVARVRLAQGRLDDALALLAERQEAAEAAGRTGSLVEILALQAIAGYKQGRTPAALQALSQLAATGSQPEDYTRLFLDEGPPMAALLREGEAASIAPAYISALLKNFTTGTNPAEQPSTQPSHPPTMAEPLTTRELEVLRLLYAGLSGPDIANRLVVGHSTVKTHLKSIYSKLNVHTRDQALARAGDLGLVL